MLKVLTLIFFVEGLDRQIRIFVPIRFIPSARGAFCLVRLGTRTILARCILFGVYMRFRLLKWIKQEILAKRGDKNDSHNKKPYEKVDSIYLLGYCRINVYCNNGFGSTGICL